MTARAPKNDAYILPREESERERLNKQHVYMKKVAYDDRLVYNTNIKLSDHAEVLDAGTGTGIWLLELAQELPPTAQLHGCDMSSNQFPKPGSYASNVHFHVHSVCDLPQDWTDKFDLASQRMLMGGLPAEDWPIALEQYRRVLKPGGHIQIVEITLGSMQYDDRPTLRTLNGKLREMWDRSGLLYDCGDELGSMLEKAGFVNVRSEKKSAPVGKARGEVGALGEIALLGGFKALRGGLLKHRVFSAAGDYDELLLHVQQECEEKGGFDVAYSVAVAEKPT